MAGAVAVADQADRLAVEQAQGAQLDKRGAFGQLQVARFLGAGAELATCEQARLGTQAEGGQRFAVGAVGLQRIHQRALQHLGALALAAQQAAFLDQLVDGTAQGVAVDREAARQLHLAGEEVADAVVAQLATQHLGQFEVERFAGLSRQLHGVFERRTAPPSVR